MKHTTRHRRAIARMLVAATALVTTSPLVVTVHAQQPQTIKMDSTNSHLKTKAKSKSNAALIAPSNSGAQKGASKARREAPSILVAPNAVAPSTPQTRAAKGADSTLQSPPAVQRAPRFAKPKQN